MDYKPNRARINTVIRIQYLFQLPHQLPARRFQSVFIPVRLADLQMRRAHVAEELQQLFPDPGDRPARLRVFVKARESFQHRRFDGVAVNLGHGVRPEEHRFNHEAIGRYGGKQVAGADALSLHDLAALGEYFFNTIDRGDGPGMGAPARVPAPIARPWDPRCYSAG